MRSGRDFERFGRRFEEISSNRWEKKPATAATTSFTYLYIPLSIVSVIYCQTSGQGRLPWAAQ
jgi:hypothetical protein